MELSHSFLPSLQQQLESASDALAKAREDAGSTMAVYVTRREELESRNREIEKMKRMKPKVKRYGIKKDGTRSKRYRIVNNPAVKELIRKSVQLTKDYSDACHLAKELVKKLNNVSSLTDERLKIGNQIIASKRAVVAALRSDP